MKNHQTIGYTAGVYDMFHIGHLKLLERAKQHCDRLIVGVNTDELTYQYKNKYPVIPYKERVEIIKSIRYVDTVVRADTVVCVSEAGVLDIYEKHRPDYIIIGDDHKDNPRWQEVDRYLRTKGSRVIFLSYTEHISSTKLTDHHEYKVED